MSSLFLYVRKSTDVEDKQVMSVERQLFELREFAAREEINIVSEIIEKQSAKVPGRPLFNDMMNRIEAGEAEGILAWHPDRLSRNGVDGGRITYALDLNKLSVLRFPSFWFENTPQGKFMLNMAFSQSKYYVDALSENTKSGLREKIRRGEFPGKAPLGYLNDYRTKKIIIDRERAPIVKEAFEMYASGTATLDRVRAFFGQKGIVSKTGHIMLRNTVSKILSNPFYYGHFLYRGEIHEGKHPALISKEVFDKADAVFKRRYRYSPSENKSPKKPFLGLLHCASCGGAITAEIQKGHTYYRCTKKGRLISWCTQPYVRQEALDAEISGLLKPFGLRPDWASEMVALIEKEKKQAKQVAAEAAQEKAIEIDKVNQKLQRLLDSFLDALIDREIFTAEKAKLMGQKKVLEEQRAAHTVGRADWLEPFQRWVLTAKNTGEIAVSGSLQEKRDIASKIFGSNLVLDCKKARGSCVKPWSFIAETSHTGGMVPREGLEPSTN
jgi:site-specific DNA recombinase